MHYSVLIVDDEKMPRETLATYIDWQALGVFKVWQAEDGEEAISIALREKPNLVISDIKMPRMDGLQLAKQLRNHCPECPFVFLSGYADKANLKEAIKLKAARFVEKPIDLEEVTSTVRELLSESASNGNGISATQIFFSISQEGLNTNTDIFKLEKYALREFGQILKPDNHAKAEEWLGRLLHGMSICHGTDIEYIRSIFRQIAFLLAKAEENYSFLDTAQRTAHLLHQIQQSKTLVQIDEIIRQELTYFFNGVEAMALSPLSKLKSYLEEHYMQPDISVQSIARALNFTSNYLCILFKKGEGRTINQYLTTLRLEKAQDLLRHSTIKLYEVAREIGYTDGKYFTRVFTKTFGMSPRQYRERYYHEKE